MIYRPFTRRDKVSGYTPLYINPVLRDPSSVLPDISIDEVDEEDEVPSFVDEVDPDVSDILSLVGKRDSNIVSVSPSSVIDQVDDSDAYRNFVEAYKKSGIRGDRFAFFSQLAKHESGYNPSIQNMAGAPAYGYFQFMQDGDRWNNISAYAGTSDIEYFRSHPELQIKAADKLADEFLNSFNESDKARAKELGYSDSALIAGAWLGGVGGVRKLLHRGVNVDDMSWSSDGSGIDMLTQMKRYNGMFRNGGVLKFSRGGDSDNAKEFLEDWYSHPSRQKKLQENYESTRFVPLPYSKKILNEGRLADIRNAIVVNDSSILPDDMNGARIKGTRVVLLNGYLDSDKKDLVEVHELSHAIDSGISKRVYKKLKDKYGDYAYESGVKLTDDFDNEFGPHLNVLRYYASKRYPERFGPDKVPTAEDFEFLKEEVASGRLLIQKGDGGFPNIFEVDNDGDVVRNIHNNNDVDHDESGVEYKYDKDNMLLLLETHSSQFLSDAWNTIADSGSTSLVDYAKHGLKLSDEYNNPDHYYDYSRGKYNVNTNHWYSRDPRTGLVLKNPNHPTTRLSWEEDKRLGYEWRESFNDRVYSDFPWRHATNPIINHFKNEIKITK